MLNNIIEKAGSFTKSGPVIDTLINKRPDLIEGLKKELISLSSTFSNMDNACIAQALLLNPELQIQNADELAEELVQYLDNTILKQETQEFCRGAIARHDYNKILENASAPVLALLNDSEDWLETAENTDLERVWENVRQRYLEAVELFPDHVQDIKDQAVASFFILKNVVQGCAGIFSIMNFVTYGLTEAMITLAQEQEIDCFELIQDVANHVLEKEEFTDIHGTIFQINWSNIPSVSPLSHDKRGV